MGYLEEILQGNYSNYNEDRLSQIFSASFNESNLFRQSFLKTIDIKPVRTGELYSKTQINYGSLNEDSRIDIIIYRKRSPFIIIENKVDSPLGISQLKKYYKIKELARTKKIALVKYYFQSFDQIYPWKIYHWSEFYLVLRNLLDKPKLKRDDKSIISNFVKHLELMRMARVNKISAMELRDLAIVLNKIKMSDKPHTALSNKNIFDTGLNLISVLEDIIELTRQEKVIANRIGKNFRAAPYLSWWYGDDDLNVTGLSITVDLMVKRSKNKIKSIGTGIFFYNNSPKRYFISTY
ncbi:MAG: PD-(D/E)XK nuclease family protein, partial [Ignavibacteriaceae bacterium]|nr:PD-(D/E)XK nuclease family protein [Ignavibacteriaceae bacterium]